MSLSTLARQPLLHFLLIAAMAVSVQGWFGNRDADPEERTIRISAADVSRTEAEWQARWNRPPTEEELSGVIRGKIRETVLYREALAMGLDEGDPVVRRMLAQKLENMARELVELSLSPTDQDLETYFAENAERYRSPPLITFTQLFLDPDRRGDRTLEDADELLAHVRSLDPPTEGVEELGDSFMLQRYYPQKDEQRIASLFGREFARSVFELPAGRWHGPVLSGYGTHLVYVDAVTELPPPSLSEVKDRVRQDWVDEKRTEITDKYFADLLERYEVIVEVESEPAP